MKNELTTSNNIRAIVWEIQLKPYGVVFLSVALTLGLTLLLYPWLHPTSMPLFFVAVMVSSWSGGLRSGLMATVLSTLAINYFFIEPRYSLHIPNLETVLRLSVFFIAAILIGLLNQSRKSALREAKKHLQTSQEAIRREQDRLAFVLRTTGIGLWLNTLPLNALNWDNQTRELFFIPPDVEPTIELFWSRIHPEDREPTRLAVEAALRDRTLYEIDHRAVSPDTGKIRWIRSAGQVICDPDGTPILFDGINYDISCCKQAEASLPQLATEIEQQLRKFDTVVSSVPDFIYTFDLSGRFTYINQPLLNLWQKTFAQAVGKTFLELDYPVDLAERLQDQIQQVIITCQPLKDETPYTSFQGTGAYEYILVPLLATDGAVEAVAGITRDITDRKQSEAKLHETLTLLKAISEYSLDIIFAKDREGRLLFVNPAISQYFGKSVAELIGKDEFFFMEDCAAAEAIRANDLRIMQSGVAEVLEEPIVIDGTLRTFLSTKAPLLDVNGNTMGIVGIGHDMTDRKQAEAALAERNQELDSFVHTVSHDLKAPLRAISNLSEWIEDDLESQLPPDNQQQLQLLRARVKRMESMINSLLVYARVGRQEAPLETFNVAELLNETIDSLAPPQSFSIEIEPPMPTLTTKRLFLSQVFANLISNAIKHHTSEQGHLNISAIEQQEFYEFSVRDDGPGIAPENHAKIFSIFQTLKAEDNSESTGVGLAIVKKIVESEKGTIRLESCLGQGTTFFFTWPKHHD
jgi:PAS domain S-box-containing protein